jgi:hypothetical protein
VIVIVVVVVVVVVFVVVGLLGQESNVKINIKGGKRS